MKINQPKEADEISSIFSNKPISNTDSNIKRTKLIIQEVNDSQVPELELIEDNNTSAQVPKKKPFIEIIDEPEHESLNDKIENSISEQKGDDVDQESKPIEGDIKISSKLIEELSNNESFLIKASDVQEELYQVKDEKSYMISNQVVENNQEPSIFKAFNEMNDFESLD